MTENEVLVMVKGMQIAKECDVVKTFEVKRVLIKALEDVQVYRAIGTVGECRTAVERMKPKKPLLSLCGDCQRGCTDCDRYEDRCPTCNGGLYIESGKPHKHCPHCGQKLDWSE